MPKNMNFKIFVMKFTLRLVTVKRAAINKGLQGTTIAPKKKPNINAPYKGFLATGACTFGRNLPTSISNINKMLIINNTVKAKGETTPMTFVKDICKNVVNINPSNIMNKMTPEDIIRPKRISSFLFDSFEDSILER